MNDYQFRTQPWQHQRQALDFVMQHPYAALLMGMGSGKTKTVLDAIVNRPMQGYVLIVAPKSVMSTWRMQAEQHTPSALYGRLVVLDEGDSKEKARKILSCVSGGHSRGAVGLPKAIFVINYESVWRTDIANVLRKYPPCWIILDESHKIKAAGSKVSKFLHVLGRHATYRNILTGTLMANSPLDVYGQYRFLDDSVFGTRFVDFRDRYAVMGGFENRQVVRWIRSDELQYKIRLRAYEVKTRDVLDLPPEIDRSLYLDFSDKARGIYHRLRKESLAELDGQSLTVANVLVKLLRLQQLTSGCFQADNGELLLVDNAKKLAVQEWLEELPVGEPAVIFCRFRFDIQIIHEACKTARRRALELSGEVNELEEWQSTAQGMGTVLIVQIQAGSLGIDLTGAAYALYYNHTFSLGEYDQSRARLVRPGQTRPVVFTHLLVRGTVDVLIFRALKNKINVVEQIMGNPRILIGDET